MIDDSLLWSQLRVCRKDSKPQTYREARPLPFELREHCNVYFQEELYIPALTLLSNLLISGADIDPACSRPILIPHAQILTLISTLIVYPSQTTRLPSHERPDAANQAVIYLGLLNRLVGPVSAGLNDALRFTRQDSPGRRRRGHRRSSLYTVPLSDAEQDDDQDAIETKIANAQSLYSRAHDFWAVVGWAFNCAHSHPHRWERWRIWLATMLDILHDDFVQRLKDSQNRSTDYQDALLSHYLDCDSPGRAQRRRVMRVIFADASKPALAEFHEVWRNETRPPKETDLEKLGQRKKLDIDGDEFADYLDIDDDEGAEDGVEAVDGADDQNTSSRPKRTTRIVKSASVTERHASPQPSASQDSPALREALRLRQRFLSLIMAHTLAGDMFMNSTDFLESLSEYLVPLPLDLFTAYIQPPARYLSPDASATLIATVIRSFISTEAPTGASRIDLNALATSYLPFAANKSDVTSTAKLSLCLETLLILVGTSVVESESQELASCLKDDLRRAVCEGIELRESKVKTATNSRTLKKKVGGSLDDAVVQVLESSGRRMVVFVDHYLYG